MKQRYLQMSLLSRLLENSAQLIDVCRKLSASEIATLMSVSEKIATLNADRFRDWNPEFNFSMLAKQSMHLKVMFTLFRCLSFKRQRY